MASYKCIIADDEPLICRLIQKLGNWKDLNIDIVAVCYDGETTVREIEHHKPDIVLSDIKMPIYNGIQIIERVNQLGLYPLFIIISGYSQFEYAQRAIQLKAVDYLVKPIHKDKLNDALLRCCDTLNKQSAVSVAAEALPDALKELLWNDLYTHKYHCPSAEDFKTKYGLDWLSRNHYAACIQVSRPELLENHTLYVDPVLSILQNVFGNYLDSYDGSDGCIYFLFSEKNDALHDLNSSFQRLFLDIKHLEETLGVLSLTIGYSDSYTLPDGLPDALKQADSAVSYRFEHGMNTICSYRSIPPITCSYKSLLTNSFTNNLIYQASNLDADGLSDSMKNFQTRFMKMKNRDYTGLKNFGYYFINTVMSATHYQEQEILQERFLFDYHFCTDYSSCFSLFLQYALSIIEAQRDAVATAVSIPVQTAQEYIHEHYTEKIYLDDLAKNVCLSSTYLSAVFKKELGMNVTEYINKTRCDVAKDLLKQTSLPSRSIAERIGYTDEKYFLHQFKKIVGITPAQFRRIYT